jgi:hypothetical protein
MSLPSLNINSIRKLKSLKRLDKEGMIYKLSNDIEKLNQEIFKLTQKNLEYKKLLLEYPILKKNIKELEDELKKKNTEKISIIKEKDDKNSELFNQIRNLENTMQMDKLNYDKNTILYQQKMSVFNHIRMENQVYAEEASKFEKEKKLYQEQKDNEIKRIQAHSILKYEKFKKQMDEDLEKICDNLIDINSEYIDSSHKLTILQNRQLMLRVEQLEKRLHELETLNQQLKKKIYENENDLKMHKLVEKNLTEKANNKRCIIRLTRNKSDYNKSENNLTSDFKIKSINFNKSKGSGSISTNTVGTKSPSFERRILNYKKLIEEKNYENEKMILMNSHLKNKLNLYQNKFNGLFNFLEESLNNFCHDEEIIKNNNFYLKLDKIKNCDFNSFNSQEKYALLVLLMKYLLPLVTINFNSTSNIGRDLFKTNLNIVNRKFNMNETFLRDETLKNAFLDKKNKIFKDVLNPRRTQFSSSVPVLKQFKDINFDLFEKKNKAII